MTQWTSYANYDEIPPALLYAMNVVYLCGEAVGLNMGGSFRKWVLKALESDDAQSNMMLDVWNAVVTLSEEQAA